MKKHLALVATFLFAATLLFGCTTTTDESEIFTPDYPTISPTEPEDPEAILAYRRDVVEQAMREQSAILWTPTETFTYSRRNNSHGIVADQEAAPEEVSTFYAGRIYQGIPYTHGSGSYYSFLSFATEKNEHGVYTLSGLNTDLLSGKAGDQVYRRARIGNDCADQLFWAWARISPSIRFGYTANMTEFYGCLKVGDYEYAGSSFSATNNTKSIVTQNGTQRMFSAYAQLQKGDGMVLINKSGAGHAVMVVTTNPVYLDDGTIDGEKSYVTVLEQTSGQEENPDSYYHEGLQQMVYPCEIMDKQWTYSTIFQKGYLPMTCQELIDPSPLPEETLTDYTDTPTLDNMFTGVIKSNYRISSVTVTISQNGKNVQEATCFGHQNEMYDFNLYRFSNSVEKPVMQGEIDKDDLPPGTYRCTFTAKLSTGKDITFRDFTFNK